MTMMPTSCKKSLIAFPRPVAIIKRAFALGGVTRMVLPSTGLWLHLLKHSASLEPTCVQFLTHCVQGTGVPDAVLNALFEVAFSSPHNRVHSCFVPVPTQPSNQTSHAPVARLGLSNLSAIIFLILRYYSYCNLRIIFSFFSLAVDGRLYPLFRVQFPSLFRCSSLALCIGRPPSSPTYQSRKPSFDPLFYRLF